MNSRLLHPVLWLIVPVLIMIAQICIELFAPPGLLGELHSETGPHEFVEFFVLLIALFVTISALLKIQWDTQRWLGLWLLLAAVCCFYVAGEEVSWGQHFLNWSTPEYWAHINDQNETNLHNTSSWLDQKPRLILLIGVVTGGLLIPLARKFTPKMLPGRFEIIYPPTCLWVIALLALSVKVIDKIDGELKDIIIFSRASEVEELYLFYFVMLYLVALRRRIVQNQS